MTTSNTTTTKKSASIAEKRARCWATCLPAGAMRSGLERVIDSISVEECWPEIVGEAMWNAAGFIDALACAGVISDDIRFKMQDAVWTYGRERKDLLTANRCARGL